MVDLFTLQQLLVDFLRSRCTEIHPEIEARHIVAAAEGDEPDKVPGVGIYVTPLGDHGFEAGRRNVPHAKLSAACWAAGKGHLESQQASHLMAAKTRRLMLEWRRPAAAGNIEYIGQALERNASFFGAGFHFEYPYQELS